MNLKVFTVIATLSFVATGCYYDVEEELYPTCTLPDPVTWSSHVQPLINANCATPGCHVPNGTGTGLLDTYAGVKAKVDDGTFQIEVIQDQTMPPSGALSNCNIQLLQSWVDAGAPEN